jgi:hypothetical protein
VAGAAGKGGGGGAAGGGAAGGGAAGGGAAGSGAAGSGGAGAGGKEGLGATCSSATACASGFCVDGVCCDAACDGVCEQCGANGACGRAATDAACTPVSCPQSTACETYPSSLTTNLCKSRGTCKTASDCPAQFTAARTPCSGTAPNQMLCDGAGACKQPTVQCGAAASCPTMPGTCEITGTNFTDPPTSTGCTTDPGPACSGSGYCVSIACDGTSDCPTGSVCCWYWAGSQQSTCTAAASCVGGAMYSAYIMCEPAMANADCPSGKACTGDYSNNPIFGSYGASYHYCK